jgi:16S rRNA (adenine1518-N6/adenine1519-N6)-dimethyltransferase
MRATPKKRLGQHFLHASGIISRIVAAISPQPGERLVEIGPGQGAITLPLLAAGARLDVIEFDRDLIPGLQLAAATSEGRLRVHHQDALEAELCAIADGAPIRLVGNLPYNISTPLLFRFIEQRHCISDMHFMLQKEVVDRMVSPPGSREYGRLSVMVQYHCAADRLFTIGPGAFNPPPKVESAFVRLTPHRSPVVDADPDLFAQVVKLAFAQRRKTLRNTLRGLLEGAEIEASGVNPGLRAEQLGLEEFASLARAAQQRAAC